MNILNTLKGWFDSENLNNHPGSNSSPHQPGSGHATSSAVAHHSSSHSDGTHSLLSKSRLDTLLDSVKKTIHQQSEQLTSAATEMGKKLSDESNETIKSVFSSLKSALAEQTSRLKNITSTDSEQTIQTNDSSQSENLNTANHSGTDTDLLSSISNTVSTSATAILSQGKEKIHRSMEVLKKPRHITPSLIRFYEHSVAAIKSKTSHVSGSTTTVADTSNNPMAQDDNSRKDNLNLDSVNSVTATEIEKTESFEYHPTSTETTPSQPSSSAINQTVSNVSQIESVASIPPQHSVAIEKEPETTTKMDFQEKDSPSPVNPSSTEKIDRVAVQDTINQPSLDTAQPLPADEPAQFKTTHHDSVQDATRTENPSIQQATTSSITADQTPQPQEPVSKSPFRIIIPLLLLASALFAVWKLGLNQQSFNFKNDAVIEQQPDAKTLVQSNTSETNPVVTENPVIVEPVRQTTVNPVNTDSSAPQIDQQVTTNLTESVKPSDIITESSVATSAEKVVVPQQEAVSQVPVVSETLPLSNLTPPIARLQTFITSADSLPATFTLYGLRFEQGSSQYRPSSAKIVTDLAALMKAYPGVQIRLESHTDTRGKAETNMELTKARANEVKNQLVSLAIDPTRIVAVGMGEEKPIDGNFEEAWRSRNRRVNVIVTAR